VRAAVVVVAVLLASAASRAQVAVVTTIADSDATQRQIAASVVTTATQRWDVLRPPLSHGDVTSCPRGDTACLRKVAAGRGATHLLVVGVGPLGIRDHVVAVQLFSVGVDKPLYEESAVQAGDAGGSSSGLTEVTSIATRLVQTAGPPPAKPYEPPTPTPPVVDADPRLFTWIGVATMIGGAAIGVGSGAAGALIASQDRNYGGIDDSLWAGSLVAAGFVTVGAALVVADAL
jgi:hypothetical protein